MTEQLINRAANLLSFMDEAEAIEVLKGTGVSVELAFLAVKAANILNKDPNESTEQ